VSALKQVEKQWAEKARALLAPYLNWDRMTCTFLPPARAITMELTAERADRLEMAIAEALADAHNEGVGAGKGF
jgi:hypothetical protein